MVGDGAKEIKKGVEGGKIQEVGTNLGDGVTNASHKVGDDLSKDERTAVKK